MKVILTVEVKSLGRKGDVVEVSDGYARNFILSKKKGLEATAANLNNLKLQKANEAKIAQGNLEKAKQFSEEISKLKVVVTMKAGEGGRVFGSVSSKEIAEALGLSVSNVDTKTHRAVGRLRERLKGRSGS